MLPMALLPWDGHLYPDAVLVLKQRSSPKQ
jgi:hypothetical protein